MWASDIRHRNVRQLVMENGKKLKARIRIERGYVAEFTSTSSDMAAVATLAESNLLSWGGPVGKVEVIEKIFDSDEKIPAADKQQLQEIEQALKGAREIYTCHGA